MARPSVLLIAATLGIFSSAAFGGSIVSVNKGRESAILKLDAGEGSGIKTGDSISFEAGGETIEAEVLGVSGKSLRLKVLFGLDSLKQGQKAQLSSGSTGATAPAPTKRDSAPARHEPADSGAKSEFVLGAGGRSHPFSGDLRAPWFLRTPMVYADHGVYAPTNPAQVTRVATWSVSSGVELLDFKAETKNDFEKNTGDGDAQSVGFTGIVNIQSGIHIGLVYGKTDVTVKNKIDYETETAIFQDDDYKAKGSDDQMTFLFGMPVNDNLSLGVAYAQISTKSKFDDSDSETTSYQILRPGVTYYTQQYEVGVVYSPPIEIHETDGGVEEPREFLFHAQYRLSDGKSAGGQIIHRHLAGIDDDGTDYFAAKGGGDIAKADWGTFGAYGIYEQKHYLKKNLAGPSTIPQLGFQFLFGLPVTKNTDVNTGLTYGRATAKTDRGDESTKLDSQVVSLFASASYQP